MKYHSLLLLSIISFSTPANGSISPAHEDAILEISDKYNEVYLGITESSVYMVVSDEVRQIANRSLDYKYKLNKSYFDDSQGNFISSDETYMASNKIEYKLSEITSIIFENGKLTFNYEHQKGLIFEEIITYNGTRALDNFYIEDLEKFVITFNSFS